MCGTRRATWGVTAAGWAEECLRVTLWPVSAAAALGREAWLWASCAVAGAGAQPWLGVCDAAGASWSAWHLAGSSVTSRLSPRPPHAEADLRERAAEDELHRGGHLPQGVSALDNHLLLLRPQHPEGGRGPWEVPLLPLGQAGRRRAPLTAALS